MRKNTKKLVIVSLLSALLVAICLLLGSCKPKPLTLTFTKIEGENAYELTDVEDNSLFAPVADRHFVVPSEYNGLPVTRIGDGCFLYEGGMFGNGDNPWISSVTIPSTITHIGANAFMGQDNIPTYIEDLSAWCNITFENEYANPMRYEGKGLYLNGERITHLTIPDDVEHIKDYAFIEGDFYSLTLPDGLKTIGNFAFQNCHEIAWELSIPDSVISIGDFAFSGCSRIVRVEVGAGVQTIGEDAFSNCDNIAETVSSSSDITLTMGGEEYGKLALSALSVYNGEDAREYSDLQVQNNFISYMGGSENILVFYIGDFDEDAVVPNGVVRLRDNCLRDMPIKSVYLPDSVLEIGAYALNETLCVNMGGNVRKVGGNAVWRSDLLIYRGSVEQWLEIDGLNTLTSAIEVRFGDDLLRGTITLPSTLTRVPNCAFYGFTGVTEFVLPQGVTEIGAYAFYECTGLQKINFPDGLITIEQDAFWGCSSLQSVTFPETLETIEWFCFFKCHSLSGTLVLPNSLTHVGDFAFAECSSLTGLRLSNQLTRINDRAFMDCTNLQGTLVIPDSVKVIEYCAFASCKNIESIALGKGLTFFYEAVFYEMNSVKSVTYAGTKKQFLNIGKHDYWYGGLPVTSIECTDGLLDISKK